MRLWKGFFYPLGAVAGKVEWGDEMFGYIVDHPDADLSFDERDNAAITPKSVVVDPAFDWDDRRRPLRALNETVIYELHVKGFSKLWDALPENLRGTHAGVGSPQAIDHLKKLGITAVELMPVHAHADGSSNPPSAARPTPAAIHDSTFMLCFNADGQDHEFTLPGEAPTRWTQIIDTAEESGFCERELVPAGGKRLLMARSLALFERRDGANDDHRADQRDHEAAPAS